MYIFPHTYVEVLLSSQPPLSSTTESQALTPSAWMADISGGGALTAEEAI